MKRMMVKEMMQKVKETREKSQEKESKKKPAETIEHLREGVADKQDKMPSEDFENTKLLPILKEAYDLFHELDSRKTEAEQKIKKIEEAKKKLI